MHVGIIMDGSGRWAEQRGLERASGHEAGARVVDAVVLAAADHGIECLTLFAFSSANWRRPNSEIGSLMRIFRGFFQRAVATYPARGMRLTAIGRRDRLPRGLLGAIERAEDATQRGTRLVVRVAIDYSSRASIWSAVTDHLRAPAAASQSFPRPFTIHLGDGRANGDVDLVVRTGGERRLSDFLLWESAFAEFVFLDRLWPDFTEVDLASAIAEFRRRKRRFGGVGDHLAPPTRALGRS